MKVALSELTDVVMRALHHYGYSADESAVIRDVLLFAQLRGNNQGIVKLIGDGIPRKETADAIAITTDTQVSALVNGNQHHAMVVLSYATDLAIAKAKAVGMSIVGNYGSDASTGALGYYVERIAGEGLIGFAFASAPFQTTAPYGSTEALFCTNPIAVGVPTADQPIILDFATSEYAYFGLIEAKVAGRAVPEGVGFDAAGNPSTDPGEIMEGAIRTIAGHKGSGLALIVQILAGPLVRAGYFGNDPSNAGNLIMAINPDILTPEGDVVPGIEDIKSRIKGSRKADGVEEILMPGERGFRFAAAVAAAGQIEVEDALWAALNDVVDSGN